MINYVKIIGDVYPEVSVSCLGDSSDYNNISFLSGHVSKEDLDSAYISLHKQEKNDAIDQRTGELISLGFSFDGQTFSLSEHAQINWIALTVMVSVMTFPVKITTKNNGEYELALADLPGFSGTALITKETHLDSGRALKILVDAATTLAEIDAIEDNR